MSVNKIEIFREKVREITQHIDFDGWCFISEDWTLGFHYPCNCCGHIYMHYTDVEIPFDNYNDKTFDSILDEFNIELIPKAKWLYCDDEILCHCGEDEYTWNEEQGVWEYNFDEE